MTTFFTFYSKSKDRTARLLSNFSEIPVKLDHDESDGGGGTQRRTYPTGEHAFHAAKYRCAARAAGIGPPRRRQLLEHAEKFASAAASTPLDAKRLGGKGKQGLRLEAAELTAWDRAAADVQRRICDDKLRGSAAIRELLASTGNQPLLHQDNRAKASNRWAGRVDKATGKVVGRNELGRIWEEARHRLGAGEKQSPSMKRACTEPATGVTGAKRAKNDAQHATSISQ